MRVLLINPAWEKSPRGRRRYHRAWPPLDLLNTAALLIEEGHDPVILDARTGGVEPDTISREADRADLVILQTSPLDRWQCPNLEGENIPRMTRSLPGEKLYLAGAHGTARPEWLIERTGARAVIRGEPEMTITHLAAANGNPSGLSGLSWRKAGIFVHEPDAAPIELDALPPPAYHLIDVNHYRYELLGPRLALLETSRGCPHSCNFCFKLMYGPGYRIKDPDRVLEEIQLVVGQWRAKTVYFIDLEFTLKRQTVLNMCRKLKKLDLDFQWSCQTRVDAVDPELLAAMKAAGCRLIHFGVETGSPVLLERTGKGISLDQVGKALRWCRDIGIKTACFFLFGLPGETEKDRRRTEALARGLGPDYASFHVAASYPGDFMSEGIPNPVSFTPGIGREHDTRTLAQAVRRAYLRFYLRPAFMIGQLKPENWPTLAGQLRLFWDSAV